MKLGSTHERRPPTSIGAGIAKHFSHAGRFGARPAGRYQAGVWNQAIAARFREITIVWGELEKLIGHHFQHVVDALAPLSERPALNAIADARLRAKIMQVFLTKSPKSGADANPLAELVSQFVELADEHKKLAIGTWWTFQDGRVFKLDADPAGGIWEIRLKHLRAFRARADQLRARLVDWQRSRAA